MSLNQLKKIEVSIPINHDGNNLQGLLLIPSNQKALIIFAHGSGSGKNSPRNEYVSEILNENGFATLLVDLLTLEEQQTDIRSQKIMCKIPGIVLNKFNIKLLSYRLTAITDWITNNVSEAKQLQIGYFGASTGAAAAIESSAVTHLQDKIFAIVSRGGRPDLAAKESIQKVKASILLIVGGNDDKLIIELNKKALKQFINTKEKSMIIIPNAGHLFEEHDALEKVSAISVDWYKKVDDC